LQETSDGKIHLGVADDGAGMPPGFDVRSQGHMGLQTVIALGENQLQGQVTFTGNQGVTCDLQFRDDKYTSRVYDVYQEKDTVANCRR